MGIELFQNLAPLLILVVAFSLLYLFFRLLTKSHGGVFSSTPILDSFSRDITNMAKEGRLDPVIGRQKEINHLVMILSKRTKNNAVLIGEAGVGKTAIVEGLAQRIADRKVTPDLFKKRVLALDLNSLLAGTKYRGEFEGRVKRITEEITNSKRNIILFIDEIHNLIEAESSGESISVGDIFKPAMARGDLQIIGATTEGEYNSYFPKDLAFKRRLQPVFVSEPNEQETLKILQGIRDNYEKYHRVKISDDVLNACIQESKEVLPDRAFPDKAIDLMDETSSKTRIEWVNSPERDLVPVVKEEDVRKVAQEYARELSEVA